MVRKQWVWVVAALLIVTFAGCGSMSQGTPDEIDETAIEADIRAQVATHYPGETFDIGVDVSDRGVVTLTGDVDDNDKRTRIGEIAKGTAGVSRVVNNIKVVE